MNWRELQLGSEQSLAAGIYCRWPLTRWRQRPVAYVEGPTMLSGDCSVPQDCPETRPVLSPPPLRGCQAQDRLEGEGEVVSVLA